MKLKFIDNKDNSILIKITIKLRFNKNIPNKLIKKSVMDINKNLKISKFISIFLFSSLDFLQTPYSIGVIVNIILKESSFLVQLY